MNRSIASSNGAANSSALEAQSRPGMHSAVVRANWRRVIGCRSEFDMVLNWRYGRVLVGAEPEGLAIAQPFTRMELVLDDSDTDIWLIAETGYRKSEHQDAPLPRHHSRAEPCRQKPERSFSTIPVLLLSPRLEDDPVFGLYDIDVPIGDIYDVAKEFNSRHAGQRNACANSLGWGCWNCVAA
jgi:hypothetical protein